MSIVVVDDEPDAADMFAMQLKGDKEVAVAYGGEEALEVIDHTTDIVLLDRRMPELSGDKVLERIRDREYDCRVVMVTGVEPDLDIVDLQFEDYLTKPVEKAEMKRVVNEQIIYARYGEAVREYTRVRSKIDVLQSRKTMTELEQEPAFHELCLTAHSIKSKVEQLFDDHDEAIPIEPGEE